MKWSKTAYIYGIDNGHNKQPRRGLGAGIARAVGATASCAAVAAMTAWIMWMALLG